MTVEAWVSAAEVETMTGVQVTDADLAQAQGVIDIYANRTMAAAGGIMMRDLGWLQRATAWQAAWLHQQFGYTMRQSATAISQDGLSVQRSGDAQLLLAPLAARALKNLTWKGSRTQRVERVEVPRGATALLDYTKESSDYLHDWGPM